MEQWQLRGLGGAVLGTPPSGREAPDVSGGVRETGALGRFTIGGTRPGQDSYSQAAHRFCVLVPGRLTPQQRVVVEGILDEHRPAHTVYGIDELGEGMRVGHRLRVRLTSFVGPGAGVQQAVVGQVPIGADSLLGRVGIRAGVRSG